MAGPLYPDSDLNFIVILLSDEDVGRVDWAYLDPFKKTYVEEYLENLPEETHSLTGTSDSGQGMSVAPSEIGSEELTSGECMMYVW